MTVLGKFAVVMADPPWDIHMEVYLQFFSLVIIFSVYNVVIKQASNLERAQI